MGHLSEEQDGIQVVPRNVTVLLENTSGFEYKRLRFLGML